jgi:antirestriction protein
MKTARLTPAQTRALLHKQAIDRKVAEDLALMDAVAAIARECSLDIETAAAIYDERAEEARVARWAEEYKHAKAAADAMMTW